MPAKHQRNGSRRTSVLFVGCLTFSVVARRRRGTSRIAPQQQPRGQRSLDSRCAGCGEDLPCASSPDQRGIGFWVTAHHLLRRCQSQRIAASWPAACAGQGGDRHLSCGRVHQERPIVRAGHASRRPMSELDGQDSIPAEPQWQVAAIVPKYSRLRLTLCPPAVPHPPHLNLFVQRIRSACKWITSSRAGWTS
jgi:hypothetical protein